MEKGPRASAGVRLWRPEAPPPHPVPTVREEVTSRLNLETDQLLTHAFVCTYANFNAASCGEAFAAERPSEVEDQSPPIRHLHGGPEP